jgi:dTDP-4-dehydrorhamnose reductase
MIKNRIYIAGAGGMLGDAFKKTFSDNYDLKCTDINVDEDWINYLDFRDLTAYRQDVITFTPNFLFHLGAHTDLEYCERNPSDTYQTNTLAVENACYIANEMNIPLLYISTAGIFDGKKTEYDDWDLPNPLCHYARSKYAGEIFVKENVAKHLICRAGWMMGGGPLKDKKFINKILKQIKAGHKELYVVNDKLGTPTYTHDFAQNVRKLLENEYWGLYNVVSSGLTSRLEVVCELLNILGLQEKISVKSVSSEHFKSEYFAPRPESERLINVKLNLRNINLMRNWKVALREYLENDFAGYL